MHARDYSEHPMTTVRRKHRAVGWRTDRTGFSSDFSTRIFRKFFGKAANILPQMKHESCREVTSECIVSEKRGDHVAGGGP